MSLTKPLLKCTYCGYEWRSWKDRPMECPRCKRYDWDLPRANNKILTMQQEEQLKPAPKLEKKIIDLMEDI